MQLIPGPSHQLQGWGGQRGGAESTPSIPAQPPLGEILLCRHKICIFVSIAKCGTSILEGIFNFPCLRKLLFGKFPILKDSFRAQFGQFVLPAQHWCGSFLLVAFMSLTPRLIHQRSKPRALPQTWRKSSPGLGVHTQIPLVCGVTEQSWQVGPLPEISFYSHEVPAVVREGQRQLL